MNGLVFYIGLGLGLACACGVRPFIPLLLAGGLASSGDLGVHFSHGHFHFLQAGWWLLVVAIAFAAAYVLQLTLGLAPVIGGGRNRNRPDPLAAAVEGIAYAGGALLFAGTLSAHGDSWWPGLIGGGLAAALTARAVGPIISGARGRLADRAAREGLTIYLDAVALVLAALVALLHPLGYVAVALAAFMLVRTRARSGERYAGLRILGR